MCRILLFDNGGDKPQTPRSGPAVLWGVKIRLPAFGAWEDLHLPAVGWKPTACNLQPACGRNSASWNYAAALSGRKASP